MRKSISLLLIFMIILVACNQNVPRADLAATATPVVVTTSTPVQEATVIPSSNNIFLFLNDKDLKLIQTSLSLKQYEGLSLAFSRIQKEANLSLTKGPYSVLDKTSIAPSGDKHDYMSMVPTSWPDEAKPGGKPYLNKDGKINSEAYSDAYDKASFDNMISSIHTLSLAYYYSQEERYAEHALLLFRTWFVNSETRMNPNLAYAQIFPGGKQGTNIIDLVPLVQLPDDLAMIRSSKAWVSQDDEGLKGWLKEFAIWLQSSELGKYQKAAKNNHSTWYDVEYLTSLLVTDQNEEAVQYMKEHSFKRIDQQIATDGTMFSELEGKDSLHNTLYSIQALIMLAMLGERVGVDIWHYQSEDGKSIKKAIETVFPYYTGKKIWPHQPGEEKKKEIEFAGVLRIAAEVYQDSNIGDEVLRIMMEENVDSPINLLYN